MTSDMACAFSTFPATVPAAAGPTPVWMSQYVRSPCRPIWQRTPPIVATRSVANARRTAWSSQRVAAKMAMGFTAEIEGGCPAPTDDVGGRFNDRLDEARTRVPVAVLRRPADFRACVDSDTWPRPTTESLGSTNGSGDKTPEGIQCRYGGPVHTIHPSL